MRKLTRKGVVVIGLTSVCVLMMSCASVRQADLKPHRTLKGAQQQVNVMPVPDKNYVPDIQLKELAEKMEYAIDPNAVWRNVNSCFFKYDIVIGDKTVTTEITFKKPDKTNSVTYLDGKIIGKNMCDGKQYWIIDQNNKKTEITGNDLERKKFNNVMSYTNISETINNFCDRVEFYGEANIYGTQCYILAFYPKLKDLEPIFLYVSKTDYLTRKVINPNNGKPYIAVIRKYELLKGCMQASETEIDMNNDGNVKLMTLSDYDTNMHVPDSEFKL
jgi:outer membrane lipoprotein-sorting protein